MYESARVPLACKGVYASPLWALSYHETLWRHLAGFGASVALKLRRCRVLNALTDAEIVLAAVMEAADQLQPAAVLAVEHWRAGKGPLADDPDEILLVLRYVLDNDPKGHEALNHLLITAAAHNLRLCATLLVTEGADVNCVVTDTRLRGMHDQRVGRVVTKSVLDVAARAAGLDGDWSCVLELLRCGSQPRFPGGILYSVLRQRETAHASGRRSIQGEVAVMQELLSLGMSLSEEGYVTLLCDVSAHGFTSQVRYLVQDLGVPVNGRNKRDGDSCTDRALAWHCWDTAQWLLENGGKPLKPACLEQLLDARGVPAADAVLQQLLSRSLIDRRCVLHESVLRGDTALCSLLLEPLDSQEVAELLGRPLTDARGCSDTGVDVAISQGHFRAAKALLMWGGRPKDFRRALHEVHGFGAVLSDAAHELTEALRVGAALQRSRYEHNHSGGVPSSSTVEAVRVGVS